jgi:hypothetical protein
MKKVLLTALGLALCLSLAVSNSSAQKPGTSPPVRLKFIVEPIVRQVGPDQVLCKICGDGAGSGAAYSDPNEYIDGVDGVVASFGKYGGYLTINFQDNGGTARTVSFDYSAPTPTATQAVPLLPIVAPKVISFKAFDPYTNLQDMTLGQSQWIGVGWSFNSGSSTSRNHGFQYGQQAGQTAYAVITCVEADGTGNCTTWELEPKEFLPNNPPERQDVAKVRDTTTVRGKSTVTDYGHYYLPFKLTLMRK